MFVTLSIFNDPETGEPNILLGARVYGVIIGILMIAAGLTVFFLVRERYFEKVVELKQEKLPIFDSLWNALKCRPFRAQLAMALSYGIGTSMLGTLGYYMTVYYVCNGDVALGSKWNFGMGISNMVFGMMGVPVFAWAAKRFGKRPAMMGLQCVGVLVFIASWWLYTPAVPWLQLFASGGIAFTTGAFWMLYGSIGADVVDYDELQTGKRREGAFMSCSTYLMKIGLAIGIGCGGFVLAATGFDAALGADQPEVALTRIRIVFMVIPIAGLVLAFTSVLLFGLTRQRMTEIRAELELRRGTV
jgi:GPH family glycoside/pentoside/hexuronide:cation symporter